MKRYIVLVHKITESAITNNIVVSDSEYGALRIFYPEFTDYVLRGDSDKNMVEILSMIREEFDLVISISEFKIDSIPDMVKDELIEKLHHPLLKYHVTKLDRTKDLKIKRFIDPLNIHNSDPWCVSLGDSHFHYFKTNERDEDFFKLRMMFPKSTY